MSMLRTLVYLAISPLLAFFIARAATQLSTRRIGMITGHQRSGTKSPTLESLAMGVARPDQLLGGTITATLAVRSPAIALLLVLMGVARQVLVPTAPDCAAAPAVVVRTPGWHKSVGQAAKTGIS